MTIRGLCNKIPNCSYCAFQSICPYNIGDIDKPLSVIPVQDDVIITDAIIRTAKILTEVDND